MKKDMKRISKFMYLVTNVAQMICFLALIYAIVFPIGTMIGFIGEDVIKDGRYIDVIQESDPIYEDFNDLSYDSGVKIVENNKLDVRAYVLIFIVEALQVAFVLEMLHNLCNIFKNIKDTETPFNTENVKHVKKVSMFILLATFVPPLIAWIIGNIIGVNTVLALKVITVVYALTTIAIANMFEYGTELQKESDETL